MDLGMGCENSAFDPRSAREQQEEGVLRVWMFVWIEGMDSQKLCFDPSDRG